MKTELIVSYGKAPEFAEKVPALKRLELPVGGRQIRPARKEGCANSQRVLPTGYMGTVFRWHNVDSSDTSR